MMPKVRLNVKIYADTADLRYIEELAILPLIKGFTTNPTLMRVAGVQDYRQFIEAALAAAGNKPISFEVLSDDLVEMQMQAECIAAFGPRAYVKVPVSTTSGDSTILVIRHLVESGARVNVTAVFTWAQAFDIILGLEDVEGAERVIISVFAGRIADAGLDPAEAMARFRDVLDENDSGMQLLWASPRQVYDAVQADRVGADIITMTPALIAKLLLLGKDLSLFSRETVQMFYKDAQAAGYQLVR